MVLFNGISKVLLVSSATLLVFLSIFIAIKDAQLDSARTQLEATLKDLKHSQYELLEAIDINRTQELSIMKLENESRRIAQINRRYEFEVEQVVAENLEATLIIEKLKGGSDEAVNSWANTPLPCDVMRLFSKSATGHQNSGKTAECLYQTSQKHADPL